MKQKKLLALNTSRELGRLRALRLTRHLPPEIEVTHHHLDRTPSPLASFRQVRALLRSTRWDLVYLEGSAIAAGANLIWQALTRRQAFLVSNGDPIGGFFKTTRGALAGAFFGLYERLLYRCCAGYAGWTPYLTGMAMAMGARRAMTVEGGVDLAVFRQYSTDERLAVRRRLGLPANHIVCGVVGSLNWSRRQAYCYGLELVEALKILARPDVSVLIVGDGNGRVELERRIPETLRSRVVFTGRLPEADVMPAMNAMDVGFVTQTLDGLGRYRLTTKLPEYLACGLPVAMSPIPGFYDYALQAGWALPAHHPADPAFHRALAAWLEGLDRREVADKAARARAAACERFDYTRLDRKFAALVDQILAERISSKP